MSEFADGYRDGWCGPEPARTDEHYLAGFREALEDKKMSERPYRRPLETKYQREAMPEPTGQYVNRKR